MNKGIDMLWMFIANEDGVVDSDVLVDNAIAMLKEMDLKEYNIIGVKHDDRQRRSSNRNA